MVSYSIHPHTTAPEYYGSERQDNDNALKPYVEVYRERIESSNYRDFKKPVRFLEPNTELEIKPDGGTHWAYLWNRTLSVRGGKVYHDVSGLLALYEIRIYGSID